MSFGLEPRTRERIMAVALLVSVFMAGLLTALAVTEVAGRARGPERGFVARLGPPEGGEFERGMRAGELSRRAGPIALSEMLGNRLDLSAEQERQMAEILERRRVVADSMFDSLRPVFEAQLDSTREEIRAILTPEQRAEFDRYVEEGRLRMFERVGGPPFGGAGLRGRR